MLYNMSKKSMAVLEITVGHWPFSDQFQHLADQIHFGRPNLLYIFNGMANDNLQKCPIFKNGRPISDPYFYHCMVASNKIFVQRDIITWYYNYFLH